VGLIDPVSEVGGTLRVDAGGLCALAHGHQAVVADRDVVRVETLAVIGDVQHHLFTTAFEHDLDGGGLRVLLDV
jgi:hypothetical protein